MMMTAVFSTTGHEKSIKSSSDASEFSRCLKMARYSQLQANGPSGMNGTHYSNGGSSHHRTVVIDQKRPEMVMQANYYNGTTPPIKVASNQQLVRSRDPLSLTTAIIASSTPDSSKKTGSSSSRQAITSVSGLKTAALQQQSKKSKPTTPGSTRFSPSRMQVDPKSVLGSVVASHNAPHLYYRIEKILQSAIYGAVYLAFEFPANGGSCLRKIALKIMLKAKHQGTLQEDITAELKFKDDMSGHPNILVFDHYWEDREALFIVMPFAEFEDLFEVIRKRKHPFAEGEARWLFRQLLSGAEYLHRKGIGFRDHSLENVLMFLDEKSNNLLPRITDPGQAIRFQLDASHRVKELRADKLFGKSFRPPEVYSPRIYNPIKVDVFCMGWMLFFTVTKHQVFDRAASDDEHWKLVKQCRYDELLGQRGGARLTKKLTNLLWKMLNPDPRIRPTAKECLNHPWFTEPDIAINKSTVLGSVSPLRVFHASVQQRPQAPADKATASPRVKEAAHAAAKDNAGAAAPTPSTVSSASYFFEAVAKNTDALIHSAAKTLSCVNTSRSTKMPTSSPASASQSMSGKSLRRLGIPHTPRKKPATLQTPTQSSIVSSLPSIGSVSNVPERAAERSISSISYTLPTSRSSSPSIHQLSSSPLPSSPAIAPVASNSTNAPTRTPLGTSLQKSHQLLVGSLHRAQLLPDWVPSLSGKDGKTLSPKSKKGIPLTPGTHRQLNDDKKTVVESAVTSNNITYPSARTQDTPKSNTDSCPNVSYDTINSARSSALNSARQLLMATAPSATRKRKNKEYDALSARVHSHSSKQTPDTDVDNSISQLQTLARASQNQPSRPSIHSSSRTSGQKSGQSKEGHRSEKRSPMRNKNIEYPGAMSTLSSLSPSSSMSRSLSLSAPSSPHPTSSKRVSIVDTGLVGTAGRQVGTQVQNPSDKERNQQPTESERLTASESRNTDSYKENRLANRGVLRNRLSETVSTATPSQTTDYDEARSSRKRDFKPNTPSKVSTDFCMSETPTGYRKCQFDDYEDHSASECTTRTPGQSSPLEEEFAVHREDEEKTRRQNGQKFSQSPPDRPPYSSGGIKEVITVVSKRNGTSNTNPAPVVCIPRIQKGLTNESRNEAQLSLRSCLSKPAPAASLRDSSAVVKSLRTPGDSIDPPDTPESTTSHQLSSESLVYEASSLVRHPTSQKRMAPSPSSYRPVMVYPLKTESVIGSIKKSTRPNDVKEENNRNKTDDTRGGGMITGNVYNQSQHHLQVTTVEDHHLRNLSPLICYRENPTTTRVNDCSQPVSKRLSFFASNCGEGYHGNSSDTTEIRRFERSSGDQNINFQGAYSSYGTNGGSNVLNKQSYALQGNLGFSGGQLPSKISEVSDVRTDYVSWTAAANCRNLGIKRALTKTPQSVPTHTMSTSSGSRINTTPVNVPALSPSRHSYHSRQSLARAQMTQPSNIPLKPVKHSSETARPMISHPSRSSVTESDSANRVSTISSSNPESRKGDSSRKDIYRRDGVNSRELGALLDQWKKKIQQSSLKSLPSRTEVRVDYLQSAGGVKTHRRESGASIGLLTCRELKSSQQIPDGSRRRALLQAPTDHDTLRLSPDSRTSSPDLLMKVPLIRLGNSSASSMGKSYSATSRAVLDDRRSAIAEVARLNWSSRTDCSSIEKGDPLRSSPPRSQYTRQIEAIRETFGADEPARNVVHVSSCSSLVTAYSHRSPVMSTYRNAESVAPQTSPLAPTGHLLVRNNNRVSSYNISDRDRSTYQHPTLIKSSINGPSATPSIIQKSNFAEYLASAALSRITSGQQTNDATHKLGALTLTREAVVDQGRYDIDCSVRSPLPLRGIEKTSRSVPVTVRTINRDSYFQLPSEHTSPTKLGHLNAPTNLQRMIPVCFLPSSSANRVYL